MIQIVIWYGTINRTKYGIFLVSSRINSFFNKEFFI